MKVVRRILGVLSLGALIGALVYLLLNPYFLRDWLVLRNYEPPARIAQIAETTGMNEKGRHLFYVHTPEIEPAEEFNLHCTIREVSIVLGCFNGTDIYIFDVTDPRLAGVQEVTAVHEMLHGAYERLSDQKRREVDGLLGREYRSITDERIRKTVEGYRARDPNIVANELHSILATEVRTLSPDLENYYSQYFTDRSKVVAFSESYEQVFSDIRQKVERLDAELALLKSEIDALEADLSTRANVLSQQRDELNSLLASGKNEEYNARLEPFNTQARAYNADLGYYRGLITSYNQKVEERNATTVEQNNLVEALDSSDGEAF